MCAFRWTLNNGLADKKKMNCVLTTKAPRGKKNGSFQSGNLGGAVRN